MTTASPKASQQQIKSVHIEKLKNLVDVEISFEPHNITAILGPNGCGKSTILHALAAMFQPNTTKGQNWKFSNFLLPNPDATWSGSKLSASHKFRFAEDVKDEVTVFTKNEDRWAPKYGRRPYRDVFYIGIDSCVPEIELQKKNSLISYTTSPRNATNVAQLIKDASSIFNRKYTTFNNHKIADGKILIGVESQGVKYSALTMSAGEQKVFRILETLHACEKYSLVLIDEIDLLLHEAALKNLLKIANRIARANQLQVVFTTHRESVIELSEIINIRHIARTPSKTLCFSETKPEAITRLTGKQVKPIEIYVEDDLSATVIRKIASNLGGLKLLETIRYGSSTNCFTVLGGLLLSSAELEFSLFVLDGDVHTLAGEKEKLIKKVISGDRTHAIELRSKAISKIAEYSIPDGESPEEFINTAIGKLKLSQHPGLKDMIRSARGIEAVDDSHKFIDILIDDLGLERAVGLSQIVDAFSLTAEWDGFTAKIRTWIAPKIDALSE